MKQIILTVLLILFSLLSFAQKLNTEYGLMVIDVQKFFIPNHKESIYNEFGINHPLKSEEIISNLKEVITWSKQNNLKTFVTFEGADTSRFNLPDELVPLLPMTQSHHYIKTNFNALQHEYFKKAVIASGIKKWIMVGAETDVCIYQTAQGLRKLNFEVFLVKEAVYSGRINTDNAIYNLQKFGVNLISTNDLPKIKSIHTSKKILKVKERLKTEDLVLTIFKPETELADSSAEQIRLNEIKKFAEGLSIPVEYYNPKQQISSVYSDKVRLVAGYLTEDAYSQLKNKSKKEIIVLSDCIPSKQFNDLNKEWYMLTYKMLFYDILGNVSSENSSSLRKLMKNKVITWPDYTQN